MTVGSKLGMLPAESKIDHSSLNYAHGDFSKFEILLGGTIPNLDRTFKSDIEKSRRLLITWFYEEPRIEISNSNFIPLKVF